MGRDSRVIVLGGDVGLDGGVFCIREGVIQKFGVDRVLDTPLAEAARGRTLDLADLKGGTFSVTNVGMIGGEVATPIINYP